MNCHRFVFPLCAALGLLIAQNTQAASLVEYFQATNPAVATHIDQSDYSAAGLNIGQDGFGFFNFGQTSATAGPVGQNFLDSMPTWANFDFDPLSAGYSFGDDVGFEAFSKGGQAGWASLTLPDGTTGASGALVDPKAAANSNNTIKILALGPGTPKSFELHVVTDNTNQEHDPASRLRARQDLSGSNIKLQGLTFNSEPDVYTFKYTGMTDGNFIKIQLNSGSANSASIAGVMFDIVPEPSSAALLVLGTLGLISRRRRR